MNGILIVAHGSRKKTTEATFDQIVSLAKAKVDVLVETAYMEFSEQTIEKGLNRLLEKGVTQIRVIPYFLFSGMHLEKDIPEEIEKFLKNRSGLTIELGRPLGADPRLAQILVDRIQESPNGINRD